MWVLKAHVEQVHKELVPANEVEKFGHGIKHALDTKIKVTSSSALAAGATPSPSTSDDRLSASETDTNWNGGALNKFEPVATGFVKSERVSSSPSKCEGLHECLMKIN